tara:strand:- start:232 stop:609 length:378 start_codon:yes stop_codon:yes gene_type:complete
MRKFIDSWYGRKKYSEQHKKTRFIFLITWFTVALLSIALYFFRDSLLCTFYDSTMKDAFGFLYLGLIWSFFQIATAKDYKLIRSKSGDLSFFSNFINLIIPIPFVLGGIYLIYAASRMCENIIHL